MSNSFREFNVGVTRLSIKYENKSKTGTVKISNEKEMVDIISSNIKLSFLKIVVGLILILAILLVGLLINKLFFVMYTFVIILGIYSLKNKPIEIIYNMDDTSNIKYKDFLISIYNMRNAKKLWVPGKNLEKRIYLEPPKLVQDKKVIDEFKIKTNVETIHMSSSKINILFLPDMMLIKENKKIKNLSYKKINVYKEIVRLVETGKVSSDSLVVDYKNKPNDRKKIEKKIPIVEYGTLHIDSSKSEIEIYMSNTGIPSHVKNSLITYSSYIERLQV